MKTLIVLGIILALVLAYVLGGRAWLKSKPWMGGFFKLVEPIELILFKKSETILWARIKILTGVLLTVLTQLGTLDLTPLMPFIPDQYEGLFKVGVNLLPLSIAVVGMIDEKLRNSTTKPIELVAIAEKDITPEVAQAVVLAEVAKEQAITVVEDAKV
jgi:Na+/proline symporter